MRVGDLVVYKNTYCVVTKMYGVMVALSGYPPNRVFPKHEIQMIRRP